MSFEFDGIQFEHADLEQMKTWIEANDAQSIERWLETLPLHFPDPEVTSTLDMDTHPPSVNPSRLGLRTPASGHTYAVIDVTPDEQVLLLASQFYRDLVDAEATSDYLRANPNPHPERGLEN